MKKAMNQYGKLVDIIESTKKDVYTCPICSEVLIRNFGVNRQYFSHPSGKSDCELKLKLIIKDKTVELSEDEIHTLKQHYYDKEFNDMHIELSDYKSEEGYHLTKEQEDIIFSTENRIKISALAGSSKTTTLYYYAKERPFKKILYIVYNRSMKEEADKTFGKLSHVDIKTQHGLAYGYVGKFYKNKLTFNYGIIDVIKDLNLNWHSDMELATKIHSMLNEYMLSDVEEFEDLDMFDEDKNERNLIINNCKRLWQLKKEYNNNVKIEHDFYLKLFQLSKKDLSNKYDIILLDEAQDSNRLILDVIKSSNIECVVVVGDPHQQLYSWRKAVNIMPLFEGKEYKLTTSFRVSQNTANIANIIIKDIIDEEINMKGFNTNQRIVDKINKNKPYVCLCRTNAYIFSEVFEVLSRNKHAKLFFEGGFSSYNFNNIKDAYYFYKGHKVKNPFLNKFKNYWEMVEYGNEVEDHEVIALVKMINKYGDKIPDIVDGIKNNTTKLKDNADVIFSTIHRAKGQTYVQPVFVNDDHFDIENVFKKHLNNEKDFNIKDYNEEMNILYVAITRAFNEIELSSKLKDYLLFKLNSSNN